jgi:hypothetical protein
MTSGSRLPFSPALAPAARRLLEALTAPGAAAALDPFDADRLVVRARRGGVSLTVASARREDAEALVEAGLCLWAAGPAGPTLSPVAAPAGAAPLDARRPCLAPDRETPQRLVDAAESPLAWLARRRGKAGEAFLGPAAFEAGERLRRDLELARMLPKITQSWAAPTGGGGRPGEATEVSLAASQRARRALGAVGGEMAGLLLDVCGFLKGLETVEAERGWPKRSGKIVLRIALDRLAAHYGLGAQATGPARAPAQSWRAAPAP